MTNTNDEEKNVQIWLAVMADPENIIANPDEPSDPGDQDTYLVWHVEKQAWYAPLQRDSFSRDLHWAGRFAREAARSFLNRSEEIWIAVKLKAIQDAMNAE